MRALALALLLAACGSESGPGAGGQDASTPPIQLPQGGADDLREVLEILGGAGEDAAPAPDEDAQVADTADAGVQTPDAGEDLADAGAMELDGGDLDAAVPEFDGGNLEPQCQPCDRDDVEGTCEHIEGYFCVTTGGLEGFRCLADARPDAGAPCGAGLSPKVGLTISAPYEPLVCFPTDWPDGLSCEEWLDSYAP